MANDLRTWLQQDRDRTQREAAAQWRAADQDAQAKGIGHPLPLSHFIAEHDKRLIVEVARRARHDATTQQAKHQEFLRQEAERDMPIVDTAWEGGKAEALMQVADALDVARRWPTE